MNLCNELFTVTSHITRPEGKVETAKNQLKTPGSKDRDQFITTKIVLAPVAESL
jgi:hypothetical protein